MADELRARGVEANYVEAPFGVDLRQFSPARRSLDWRRSLGIGDDEVVVAFVGRLVWEKGLGVFADALYVLQAEGLRFQVLVVATARPAKGCKRNCRTPSLPAISAQMRWRRRMRPPISS